MFDFKFTIHADCPCSPVASFIDRATFCNVTLAKGPENGLVLGINGASVKSV